MNRLRLTRGRITTVLVLGSTAGTTAWLFSRQNENGSRSGLNTSTFTQYNLLKIESTSSTSSIFTLKHSHSPKPDLQAIWKKGVWSVQIKQPQLQIARAYTPLPSSAVDTTTTKETGNEEEDLKLLIRRENNGEVSNYLHRLNVGATVELRGPTIEYALPENIDEIVFLAGGTGIAPALQLAYGAKDQKSGNMKMAILWANRKREDCVGGMSDTKAEDVSGWFGGLSRLFGAGEASSTELLPEAVRINAKKHAIVEQLEKLKDVYKGSGHSELKVDYFIDEEGSFITAKHVTKLTSTRSTRPGIEDSGKKLIIVSGPEGFVKYWAGPKRWTGGREVQGPLAGILGRLNIQGWQVVKL